MIHQSATLPRAIKRSALVFALTASHVATSLGAPAPIAVANRDTANRAAVARQTPNRLRVNSLNAAVRGDATLIELNGNAPLAYAVHRTSPRTLIVELPGADLSALASRYEVAASPLVGAVGVQSVADAKGTLNTRLEISLRVPVRDRTVTIGNEFTLELLPVAAKADPVKTDVVEAKVKQVQSSQSSAPATAAPQSKAQISPSTARPAEPDAPQSQGQRYGQSGFIGEPINLNVVNADIRDLLNYITEQYGVNFVIDRSVGAVPVTVNVTDVPWNIALDSILRANRLGIDVSGNILRVATREVLAAESAQQAQINEGRLNAAPLVTEFIRLNYARAVGTLAQAAGSAGGFAGGTTGGSFSGGSGGDATGRSGDQGILPIISRRLSRRGSVEVDGRSNTLIITDVPENIAAIRQLITLLDQPEPQVEIEARIVIANRNFSRDLGVQLQAAVFGSRGQAGAFETAPAAPGLLPGGIPGGLSNAPPASGALGATAPNTVIGLTTGIFGTAQISALITAAELKGQAKTVATPRVTAMNNRPAQIETGQQIPVVTPQTGAGGTGGALIFTTTYVAVPLRLSVTPQISDAGTVILRVVAENNTINQAIATVGAPGIDTQRMQTEVLVPDGGTTVIGGALNDNEADGQTRTPGLGNLPVIGNLFKRRTTDRTTSEILFFITPRIYRPDYQGNQIAAGAPATSTRSVQIAQPVPLGNPSSNTPTPTQLQQQQPQIGPQSQGSPTTINAPSTTVVPGARP